MNNIFSILILLLLSCNNKRVEKIDVDKPKVTQFNDTICATGLNRFKLKEAVLLKACHVVYNDSLSGARQLEFSKGQLSKEFNFDNHNSNLSYVRNGDTIDLKILFLTRTKDTIVPNIIQIMDDTLFVREKTLTSNGKLGGFEFEELHYQFLMKSHFKPIIRYMHVDRK